MIFFKRLQISNGKIEGYNQRWKIIFSEFLILGEHRYCAEIISISLIIEKSSYFSNYYWESCYIIGFQSWKVGFCDLEDSCTC